MPEIIVQESWRKTPPLQSSWCTVLTRPTGCWVFFVQFFPNLISSLLMKCVTCGTSVVCLAVGCIEAERSRENILFSTCLHFDCYYTIHWCRKHTYRIFVALIDIFCFLCHFFERGVFWVVYHLCSRIIATITKVKRIRIAFDVALLREK
ncbi:hypothetical protein EGR_03166 [Echinococcus granulosus]|uniref:Uncharacterized protein n=1 Tax=Echinococcus granulosus TaxID=6210 RepID=W6ULD8_ECHGR|nr:hypothetical protein EGR_03166 [Echinococcus granulosus]EUB61893.1 hypothetical protein EGR_03166 [Echinococcus granulosus]